MQSGSPRKAIDLIQTRMASFARGQDDDPRKIVDGLMHDIEALLSEQDEAASAHLTDITGHTKGMLINAEREQEPDKRHILFLRSLAQLLISRLNVSS